MKRYFEVSWYMECYPLPDKCGKQIFDSREAAEEFRWKLHREGYTVWFRPMVYDPDEEGGMNIEKFEEILRWKYDNGVHDFVGNLSGNKYHIQNPSGKIRGYALFVNDKLVCCNTRFTNVAWRIWDIESEVAGVKEEA